LRAGSTGTHDPLHIAFERASMIEARLGFRLNDRQRKQRVVYRR
jgi:hypothetical protein